MIKDYTANKIFKNQTGYKPGKCRHPNDKII